MAEDENWDQRNVRATFWLDRELRAEVKAAAASHGVSLAQFVTQALRAALDDET